MIKECKNKSISILEVSDFKRIPGKGVQGSVNGKTVFVGGEAMLDHTKVTIPESTQKEMQEEGEKGRTIVYVIQDDNILGSIVLADIIREESHEAVQGLRNDGLRVGMITGDSEGVAKWVAKELGIDMYFARVLPENKSNIVKEIQDGKFRDSRFEIRDSHKSKVAFVGDGINDAPALTQADLGIAIGAGTNVAIESAGIILMRDDPRDIAKIIKLSKLTYTKMIQNLFWAAGYNVVAIPLAAGVLVSQGITLQPAVGAVFMSLSTVIVAANALILKRKKI